MRISVQRGVQPLGHRELTAGRPVARNGSGRLARRAARGLAVAAACGLVLLSGCGKKKNVDQQRTDALPIKSATPPDAFFAPVADTPVRPESFRVRPDYRLKVFDEVEVMYSVRLNDPLLEDQPSRIEKFDEISLVFFIESQTNLTQEKLIVGGDGRVRLPLVGELIAEGKTGEQFENEVREKMRQFIRDPQFYLRVEPKNRVLVDLIDTIKTSPRGASRLVPVRPDGKISAILVSEVQAEGRTIREVQDDLNQAYRDIGLNRITVTVQLLTVSPERVYVLGEVGRNGLIEVREPITMTNAFAIAGGLSARSDTSRIVLVRRKNLPVPQGVIINLNKIQTTKKKLADGTEVPDFAMYRYDPYLYDGDVVIVPPNGLAKFNDWVDMVFTKGIRSIVPYGFNFGMNVNYQGNTIETRNDSNQNGRPVPLNFQFGG